MTEHLQLTKGLEEEVYTGRPNGEVVGLSERIAEDLEGYECEPDNRNAEFGTHPHRDYPSLKKEMMGRRMELREYLREHDGLTLIPGGALSLGDTSVFHRSKPDNPYHGWIENAYGTDVVTASTHINMGIDDPEEVIRAFRVIRCEAALFLALTASSPFLDGRLTGYHSYRWHMFPKTPPRVPVFENYAAYTAYVDAQLASGVMQNSRHLWLGTRPNGHAVPHEINRLELRICDRIDNIDVLIAICALFEARIWQILEQASCCPLGAGLAAEDLVDLIDTNEEAVAKSSLDAEVVHWCTRETVRVRDWLGTWLDDLSPVAEAHGLTEFIEPIHAILQKGNVAMRWIAEHEAGKPIPEVIENAIRESAEKDLESTRPI